MSLGEGPEAQQGYPGAPEAWRLQDTPDGLRLNRVVRRALGSAALTWGDLLASRLSQVQVYALYFPSRFDLDMPLISSVRVRNASRWPRSNSSQGAGTA